MLRSISLRNFKAFSDLTLPLAPLTLLMGENGAGKSSLIQSILLIRQSVLSRELQEGWLALNGSLASVGVGVDLLRAGADEEQIGVSFSSTDGASTAYTFAYEQDADRLKLQQEFEHPAGFPLDGFTYLAAERLGPRLTNPRSLAKASQGDIGTRGEGALAALESHRADILANDDPRRKGKAGSLEELFQIYLSEICPNARIELHPYANVDTIGSTFSFSAPGGLPGLPLRPTNVGFGVSYALPIIVACLVAKPSALLIIENPEAHLHTRSQRAMCDLLMLTAMAGVQVIVETHSREIFHWLRNESRNARIPPDVGCVNYIEASIVDGQRSASNFALSRLDAPLSDLPNSFYDAFGSPTDLVAPVGPV